MKVPLGQAACYRKAAICRVTFTVYPHGGRIQGSLLDFFAQNCFQLSIRVCRLQRTPVQSIPVFRTTSHETESLQSCAVIVVHIPCKIFNWLAQAYRFIHSRIIPHEIIYSCRSINTVYSFRTWLYAIFNNQIAEKSSAPHTKSCQSPLCLFQVKLETIQNLTREHLTQMKDSLAALLKDEIVVKNAQCSDSRHSK